MIRIVAHILREAKRRSAEQGASLRIIKDVVLKCVKRRHSPGKAVVELPTFGTRGVNTGVDLDSSAELLRRMEDGS